MSHSDIYVLKAARITRLAYIDGSRAVPVSTVVQLSPNNLVGVFTDLCLYISNDCFLI